MFYKNIIVKKIEILVAQFKENFPKVELITLGENKSKNFIFTDTESTTFQVAFNRDFDAYLEFNDILVLNIKSCIANNTIKNIKISENIWVKEFDLDIPNQLKNYHYWMTYLNIDENYTEQFATTLLNLDLLVKQILVLYKLLL